MTDLIPLYNDSLFDTISMFVLFVILVILYFNFMKRREHTMTKRVFRDISVEEIYKGFEKEFDHHSNKEPSKCLVSRDKRVFLRTPKHRISNGVELHISIFKVNQGLLHLYQIQSGGYIFIIDELDIAQVIVQDGNGSREIEGKQLERHLKKRDSFLNKRKRVTFEAIVDFLELAY